MNNSSRDQEPGRQLLHASAIRSPTSRRRTRHAGALPFFGRTSRRRASSSRTRIRSSVGWSHELDAVDGHRRRLRARRGPRPRRPAGSSTRITAGRHAALRVARASARRTSTIDISIGASKFDGVNIGVRRRMRQARPVQRLVLAGRTPGASGGNGGRRADDATWCRTPPNPFADVQWGPSGRTDARHRSTLSADVQAAVGHLRLADLPLPLGAAGRTDLDGVRPQRRRREQRHLHDGVRVRRASTRAGNPSYKDIGACTTINCGRGAALSQFNLRVSKVVRCAARGRTSRRSARSSTCSTRSTRLRHRRGGEPVVTFLHRDRGEPYREHGVHEAHGRTG